jgi:hypothetical protein
MPRAKALKVRVEDKPGLLGEMAAALGDKKVNILALNAWVEGAEGVVRMVVGNVGAAKRVLAAKGWKAEDCEVLEVEIADKPGTLGAVAKALGAAGVNIEYVFQGVAGARKATVFMGVSDLKTAIKALR